MSHRALKMLSHIYHLGSAHNRSPLTSALHSWTSFRLSPVYPHTTSPFHLQTQQLGNFSWLSTGCLISYWVSWGVQPITIYRSHPLLNVRKTGEENTIISGEKNHTSDPQGSLASQVSIVGQVNLTIRIEKHCPAHTSNITNLIYNVYLTYWLKKL